MFIGLQVEIEVVEDTPDFVGFNIRTEGGRNFRALRVSRGLSREQAESRIGMVVLELLEGTSNKGDVRHAIGTSSTVSPAENADRRKSCHFDAFAVVENGAALRPCETRGRGRTRASSSAPHAARIRTPPSLIWGPSVENAWLAERAKRLGKEWCCPERMNKRERAATPLSFRDLLISIAQAVP